MSVKGKVDDETHTPQEGVTVHCHMLSRAFQTGEDSQATPTEARDIALVCASGEDKAACITALEVCRRESVCVCVCVCV
jgi:hypothetical protein